VTHANGCHDGDGRRRLWIVAGPVFLYDGDCAFCSSCVRLIQRRIPTHARIVAWQFADLDTLGVDPDSASAAVQWIDHRGVAAGPEAIARLLSEAGSYWRPLGVILGTRPFLWIAWPVYRWVARNRHRLPGGTPACSVSQARGDG